MLKVSRRALSTDSKAQLDRFFQYYNTKAEQRPWIYRPKNANILLTLDLKDPQTGKLVTSREPSQLISKSTLTNYINSLPQDPKLLPQWLNDWTAISPRKKPVYQYISPKHVEQMLYASFFKLGGFRTVVHTLYSRRPQFVKALNRGAYDTTHFFQSILVCNLHRNALQNYNDGNVALNKMTNAYRLIAESNDKTGLPLLLLQTMGKQLNQSFESLTSKKTLKKELTLPTVDSIHQPILKQFIADNEGNYIACRTIKDFDPSQNALDEFIQLYKLTLTKVNKQDVYDQYLTTMKQLWTKSQA